MERDWATICRRLSAMDSETLVRTDCPHRRRVAPDLQSPTPLLRYFRTLPNHEKVFSATRDAIANALAASSTPLLEERLFELTENGSQK